MEKDSNRNNTRAGRADPSRVARALSLEGTKARSGRVSCESIGRAEARGGGEAASHGAEAVVAVATSASGALLDGGVRIGDDSEEVAACVVVLLHLSKSMTGEES
jgi:hypothetical protein